MSGSTKVDTAAAEATVRAALAAKPTRAAAPAAEVARAVTALGGAARPVVVVGSDVVREGATAELIAFVEGVGGAVLTQMDARGAYPED